MNQTESLIDVLDEARAGRSYALIGRLVRHEGLEVKDHTVRRWLRGDRTLPITAQQALFDALNMSEEQRARAVKAASR